MILILSSTLLFCVHPQDKEDPSFTQVRVGIFPFAPINYIDKSGVPSGLYPSLLSEITKDTNWSVRYVDGSWSEGLERLQNGEIDLVMSVAWSESRAEIMDFTKESVVELWGQVFTRPDSGVRNIDDLEGLSVGIMKSDISGRNFVKTAESLKIQCHTVEYPTFHDVMIATENRTVQAGVAPQHFGLRHIHEYKLIGTNILFSPFSIYFAAKKGMNQDLLDTIDSQLTKWKKNKDSVYYQLIRRWMSSPDLQGEEIPLWLKVLLLFFIFATLGITYLSFQFKRAANTQTREYRNKEYQYRSLVEQINGIILRLNPEGKVLLINDYGLNLLRSEEEEIVGKYVWELGLLPESATPDKIRTPGQLNQINLEKSVNFGDRRVVLQWSLSTISDSEGSVLEILCMGMDISDRIAMENALKESEAKFISFMRNIPAYAFIKKINGEHIYSNPATLALLDNHPSVLGTEDIYRHPEERKIIQDAEKRIISGVSQSESIEFEARLGSSSEPVLLQEKRFPIFTEDGKMLLGGLAFDITESRAIEDQLNQSRKMQAIGVLAGGIAHDFNNQLSGIMGYADLLTQNVTDPTLTRYATKLMESIDRASSITRQLLRFSRKEKRETHSIQMNDLIDDLITLLSHSIEKQITIDFSRRAEDPGICGDSSLIQNALLNISLNARDAMEGSGSLIFSTEHVDVDVKMAALQGYALEPGNYLVVSVEDTGKGIPKETKEKIFEPFFTTKPKGKGTGMGLAMVYGTMKDHHGNITVQSTTGKGTVFKLYFPAAAETKEGWGNAPIPAVETPVKTSNIAVVDDESMIRDFLDLSLKEAGHRTTIFEGGAEFVLALQKDPESFDLVILDMIMPGMSGLETYQALSTIRPDLPVLLSSGYSPKKDLKAIMENPAVKYLQKPYSISNLLNTISNMVNP